MSENNRTVSIYDHNNLSLGEGPVWCKETGSLAWVDINKDMLYIKNKSREVVTINLPFKPSKVVYDKLSNDKVWLLTDIGVVEYELTDKSQVNLYEITGMSADTR